MLTVLKVLRVLTVLSVLTVLLVPTALVSLAALSVVAADWEPRFKAQRNRTLIGVEGRDNRNASLVSLNRFVALAWTATVGKTTDVFFSVSRDGSPFDPPRQVNDRAGDAVAGGEQPPRVLLSAGSGTAGPRVAIVWASHLGASAIRLARSANGGREFMPAESVSPPGASGHRGWPAAAADRAGNAHVVWLDHGNGSWVTARSTSLTASASKSTAPARIAEGVCYCCKTAVAAGPRGMLCAAWRHVYPGNIRDIAVAVSRDAGATFESPVRVSEDGWEINGCPDDGPAVAVDSSGTLHIAWPTVVAHASLSFMRRPAMAAPSRRDVRCQASDRTRARIRRLRRHLTAAWRSSGTRSATSCWPKCRTVPSRSPSCSMMGRRTRRIPSRPTPQMAWWSPGTRGGGNDRRLGSGGLLALSPADLP